MGHHPGRRAESTERSALLHQPRARISEHRGDCNNKECSFLHVKPASKTQDCPWYDQGFCKNGPLCKYRHIHRVMCINYLAGFCPEGPKCQFTQPISDLCDHGFRWDFAAHQPQAFLLLGKRVGFFKKRGPGFGFIF
nr:putative cleavage and polyadenylation specificity factor subunit 4-like protein isoform X3 [Loxodonta africana]